MPGWKVALLICLVSLSRFATAEEASDLPEQHDEEADLAEQHDEEADSTEQADEEADSEDPDSDGDEGEGEQIDLSGQSQDDGPQEGDDDVSDQEDPSITPEQLHKLHAKIDVDSNGKLSLDELIQFARDYRKEDAIKDGHEHLDSIDEDKDGKASWDEMFKDAYTGKETEGMDEQMIARWNATRALEEAKFKAADGNSDGLLDQQELNAYFFPEYYESTGNLVAQHSLDARDLDKDGFLTSAEFHGEDPRDEEPRKITDEEIALFKKCDEDSNGKIDVKEMAEYDSGHINAAEELEAFFKLADTNSDQHVTVEELHAAHEHEENEAKYVFVGMVQHHEL